jgi:hypothetical protein
LKSALFQLLLEQPKGGVPMLPMRALHAELGAAFVPEGLPAAVVK